MLGRMIVGVAAAALLAYAVGLAMGAEYFPAPGSDGVPQKHVILFVVATVAAALLHVASCVIGHYAPPRLFYVLLVAFAARTILVLGAPGPILEGEVERTRFDARLTNLGFNPYEFKPLQLADGEEAAGPLLTGPQLERLTRARAALTASVDAPRPELVHRPDLRSRSTPLSLWVWSLADGLHPSSPRGFAIAILAADLLAIVFLLLALHALRLPLAWVMVYAWSPILLKEAYCTMTADALLMPALAGLVWCIAKNRRLLMAVPLALAAGLRFPLLLLGPVLGRRAGILGVLLAATLFAGPFLPFVTPDVPVSAYAEGHVHTWRHYEYNSMLENPVRAAVRGYDAKAENSLAVAGVDLVDPGAEVWPLLAKLLTALVVVAVVVYLMIREPPEHATADVERGLRDLFLVIAAVLVTSPVLHPRHAIWLLPVLAVRPYGLAWLLLPGLVSLSYLTHLNGPQAADLTFLDGMVSFRAVEFGLFLALLLFDRVWAERLFGREPSPEVAVGTEEDLPFDYADVLDEYGYEYEDAYASGIR